MWTAWSFAPPVVMGLVLSAIAYAVGVRVLWRRAGSGRGITRAHVAAFAFGLVLLAVALLSPVDTVSEALFSVHMVQHLLLVLAVAPLLVLGAPQYVMMWVLPTSPRRALGQWWHRAPWISALCRALTHPIVAWGVHVFALWVWHAPKLYDAALRDPRIHALEHITFLATALLFWWVLIRGRMSLGASTFYVFGAALQCTLLGALLALARQPWYFAHYQTTQAWGMTPLEDQQVAGLIMWVPAGLVYLAALAPRWIAALRHQPFSRPPAAVGAIQTLEASAKRGGTRSDHRDQVLSEQPTA